MDTGSEDNTPIWWPIATIDFEASAIGAGSYPIEVGVCVWRAPGEPIGGWSTLIQPTAEWERDGESNAVSAGIHRISRADLATGMTPTDAVTALNALLANVGWCDGGAYDLDWARTLARASRVRATFRVGHWDMLTRRLDQFAYMRLARWMDRTVPRHRARDDAERLIKGHARAMRVEHGTSVDLRPNLHTDR